MNASVSNTTSIGIVARHIGKIIKSPFLLLDVGASGGIGESWRHIGPRLAGFGFDPNRVACAELNKLGDPIRYIASCIVGPPASSPHYDLLSTYPGGRLHVDAVLAAQRKTMDQYFTPSGVDFVRSHQAGQVPKVNAVEQRKFNIRTKADDAFTLDDFANRQSLASIDFIKIDTDGTDFDVLRGAEASLFKRNVLGVQIEAQFAGSTHPLTNTFANIDVFMRRQGFTLFSIPELNKYARMQIPGKFVHSFPSQGYFGQLLWCDAVYLRDVCRPDYFSNWPIEFGLDKLLNLLCLFDLYGLPDCGAELTLSFSDELTRSGIDPMPILNLFRQQADVIDPVS